LKKNQHPETNKKTYNDHQTQKSNAIFQAQKAMAFGIHSYNTSSPIGGQIFSVNSKTKEEAHLET